MTRLKSLIQISLFAVLVNLNSCKAQYSDLEDGIYAEFVTTKGTMLAQLEHTKAPITVANFVSLAEGENTMVDSIYKDKKYYNGLKFHRVIKDFMIQGGDPLGTGSGNPGYKFNDEFHPDLKHSKKGILSMANSGYGTNGSQFYITHKETSWLDAYDENNILKKCEDRRISCHAVFGEIIMGIEIIDSIEQDDIISEINIIRQGRDAKKFKANKLFINHFAEAERLEKEKIAKAEAILEATKEKFKKQREQATKLPSGLQYTITEKGTGKKLSATSKVSTHYALFFEDGKLLDTSNLETAEACDAVNEEKKLHDGYKPIIADIGPDAGMISGFKEGLQQLSVGDKATLFIPYHLGYGESGNRGIPGKTDLIFEVEIIQLIK